jgi:hypothetical protein
LTPARFERVQTDRSARLVVDQTERVKRRVLVVARVAIVVGEQLLLKHEHRSPELEVGLEFLGGGGQAAFDRSEPRRR